MSGVRTSPCGPVWWLVSWLLWSVGGSGSYRRSWCTSSPSIPVVVCLVLLLNPLVLFDSSGVSAASKKDDVIEDVKDGKELQKLIEEKDYVAVLWCKSNCNTGLFMKYWEPRRAVQVMIVVLMMK